MPLASPKPLPGEEQTLPTWVSEAHDRLNLLMAPPRIKLRRVANQAAAHVSWTAVIWDTKDRQRGITWSVGTNPSRITCVTPGAYQIFAACQWNNLPTGTRTIALRINGVTTMVPCRTPGAAQPISLNTGLTLDMVAGDYIEVMLWHDQGGSLTITNNGFTDGDAAYVCVDYRGESGT